MKIKLQGLSLVELLEQYGKGSSGFYSDWWIKEDFAKEKPEEGIYDIDFTNPLFNLTFEEQKKKMKKGFEVAHPAVIAEAILSIYAKTKKRWCENHWLRTSYVDLGGHRVLIGYFVSDSLNVNNYWDDNCNGSFGVSCCKKIGKI